MALPHNHDILLPELPAAKTVFPGQNLLTRDELSLSDALKEYKATRTALEFQIETRSPAIEDTWIQLTFNHHAVNVALAAAGLEGNVKNSLEKGLEEGRKKIHQYVGRFDHPENLPPDLRELRKQTAIPQSTLSKAPKRAVRWPPPRRKSTSDLRELSRKKPHADAPPMPRENSLGRTLLDAARSAWDVTKKAATRSTEPSPSTDEVMSFMLDAPGKARPAHSSLPDPGSVKHGTRLPIPFFSSPQPSPTTESPGYGPPVGPSRSEHRPPSQEGQKKTVRRTQS